MSTSETDSEPESELPTDTISSLTRFAHLSATRPAEDPISHETSTVSWAVDTLATLDFRLVRKDNALHGLIQNCACTILALFDTVLQQGPGSGASGDGSSDFIPDVASILRLSFLHLLFQYRRLFRVIATRDFRLNSTLLAVICWVDVVLAKLGDVVAFIAAGLADDQSLPEFLKGQKEEDNLRAAIQLPDNWDMLPSMLLSERVSVAAKRLSIRLMLGGYILHPALSGQVGVDNTINKLHRTFAEFVKQSATRTDELRSVLGPNQQYLIQQERLTSAMAISLFAAADIAQAATIDPEHTAGFRPQTMAAVMQLLRFVLDLGGYPTQTAILSPVDFLDIPTSVVLRWGIIPQWTWSIWMEYRSLYAETISHITTAYIQHYSTTVGAPLEISDLMSTNSRSNNQGAVISVMIDLVFRFTSVLSACRHPRQLSPNMMSVLYGACRLISQWIDQNSCGIRNSKECCKALVVLFGYSSLSEQNFTLNDMILECLAPVKEQCIRDAWKAAVEDNDFCFLEALGQSFTRARVVSTDGLPNSGEVHVTQLMQFLVVMTFKGVNPLCLDPLNFIEAVGERVLATPANDLRLLRETFLVFLAIANLFVAEFPIRKVAVATDDEAIWRLGMCTGEMDLFAASAFALYITSSVVSVEPLTYLEGLEHLLDIALLICSRQYPREDEPLGLVVLPTIFEALTRLLESGDNSTGAYTCASMRISALGSVMQSLDTQAGDDSRYTVVLKKRIPSAARRVLGEVDGKQGWERREHELLFCRVDGLTHMLVV